MRSLGIGTHISTSQNQPDKCLSEGENMHSRTGAECLHMVTIMYQLFVMQIDLNPNFRSVSKPIFADTQTSCIVSADIKPWHAFIFGHNQALHTSNSTATLLLTRSVVVIATAAESALHPHHQGSIIIKRSRLGKKTKTH